MRHLAIALVLACVLSGTVLAGEIPTTGATAPQPPPCPVVAGDIHTTSATATGESSTVFTLILTLLSIVS
jgi:hypothetical protein